MSLRYICRRQNEFFKRLNYYHIISHPILPATEPTSASERAAKGDIGRLERIQRKGIKIVEGLGKRDHTAQAMKPLRIMPISEKYKYLNSLWGLKVYAGMATEGVQKL